MDKDMEYEAMFSEMMNHLEAYPTPENEDELTKQCSLAIATIAAASESVQDLRTRLREAFNRITYCAVHAYNETNGQSLSMQSATDILMQHNPGKFDA